MDFWELENKKRKLTFLQEKLHTGAASYDLNILFFIASLGFTILLTVLAIMTRREKSLNDEEENSKYTRFLGLIISAAISALICIIFLLRTVGSRLDKIEARDTLAENINKKHVETALALDGLIKTVSKLVEHIEFPKEIKEEIEKQVTNIYAKNELSRNMAGERLHYIYE